MADLEQVVFETIRAQMCPAVGIDSNKDKLDLQTVQQAEHEEKLRSIQDSKRHLYTHGPYRCSPPPSTDARPGGG